MTLHEASAVFLIIGGVLLGPIEGKYLSNIDVVHDCVRAHGIEPGTPMVAAPESCPRITVARETTAETCARAMREVGARPYEGMKGAGWIPQTFADGSDGIQVRCIPAPSGLVK